MTVAVALNVSFLRFYSESGPSGHDNIADITAVTGFAKKRPVNWPIACLANCRSFRLLKLHILASLRRPFQCERSFGVANSAIPCSPNHCRSRLRNLLNIFT